MTSKAFYVRSLITLNWSNFFLIGSEEMYLRPDGTHVFAAFFEVHMHLLMQGGLANKAGAA